MSAVSPDPITIQIDEEQRVSALLHRPPQARACCVLAHGAGAGMRHPFMTAAADGLAERGIATLRFQFPYMERRSPRPDPPKVAQAAVRAAVSEAARQLPTVPLFAGGKSYGGRMASGAQAEAPLPGVRGIVFLGFPLHPPGKPSDERAAHLSAVTIPMLFLQGERDELADLKLLAPLVQRLGARATLKSFAGADHSFRVPERGGGGAQAMAELVSLAADWMTALAR